MTRDAMLAETATAIGLADPAPLAALSLAEIAWLRDAAYRAREREQAALDTAIDQAMEHVPALLRGAVRRMLFP